MVQSEMNANVEDRVPKTLGEWAEKYTKKRIHY
jgi:hypothetical protein